MTRKSEILVLCKTYPSPSSKYSETSCVAGVEGGKLIRLFPVPFRLIKDEQQFKKWQVIEATIEKARNDLRPESHHIKVDTIERNHPPLSTKNLWLERLAYLSKTKVHHDFDAVETARLTTGATLALLRPSEVTGLDITPVAIPTWTSQERDTLLQHQKQAGLFDDTDVRALQLLRKLPYDFHYRYRCDVDGSIFEYRHKLVDWEIGALFWNCKRSHGPNWEKPFRAKLEGDLPSKDLMFLMGTIHRFPNQWLVVSLIYPPKPLLHQVAQKSLFDL